MKDTTTQWAKRNVQYVSVMAHWIEKTHFIQLILGIPGHTMSNLMGLPTASVILAGLLQIEYEHETCNIEPIFGLNTTHFMLILNLQESSHSDAMTMSAVNYNEEAQLFMETESCHFEYWMKKIVHFNW